MKAFFLLTGIALFSATALASSALPEIKNNTQSMLSSNTTPHKAFSPNRSPVNDTLNAGARCGTEDRPCPKRQ